MTEVIINKQATINAEGTHNTKGNKSVVCLTTREVFVSGLDASLKCNVSRSEISRCCRGQKTTVKGMRFCFLNDITTHLNEILVIDPELIKKAAAYDAIVAEREAEEKRKAELARAEHTYKMLDREYNKTASELVKIQNAKEEAYKAFMALKGQSVTYAI